jgi:hypothetical protein
MMTLSMKTENYINTGNDLVENFKPVEPAFYDFALKIDNLGV